MFANLITNVCRPLARASHHFDWFSRVEVSLPFAHAQYPARNSKDGGVDEKPLMDYFIIGAMSMKTENSYNIVIFI